MEITKQIKTKLIITRNVVLMLIKKRCHYIFDYHQSFQPVPSRYFRALCNVVNNTLKKDQIKLSKTYINKLFTQTSY